MKTLIITLAKLSEELVKSGFLKAADDVAEILQTVLQQEEKKNLLNKLIERFEGKVLPPDPDSLDKIRILFPSHTLAKEFHRNIQSKNIDASEPRYEEEQVIVYVEKFGKEEQNTDDVADIAANVIGLQEDGTASNMNQGYALPPAFSPYGPVGPS